MTSTYCTFSLQLPVSKAKKKVNNLAVECLGIMVMVVTIDAIPSICTQVP